MKTLLDIIPIILELQLYMCTFVYSPTGFNSLLCHYALGDKEKMKKTFLKLLTVSLGFDDEDKYTLTGVRKC